MQSRGSRFFLGVCVTLLRMENGLCNSGSCLNEHVDEDRNAAAKQIKEVMLHDLASMDYETRAEAASKLQVKIVELLDSVESGETACDGDENDVDGLRALLPHLLHLSIECPFEDVRENLGKLLRTVEVRHFSVWLSSRCHIARAPEGERALQALRTRVRTRWTGPARTS